ncbi:MAG: 2-C-methyl-D-erythritol 4-phosphate cytidylyltransferase [Clostridia bacterium]|nr:2-C-methyl-D-erythritol 4-phosphate cytidylyltransferase [Clostridia bacterium]
MNKVNPRPVTVMIAAAGSGTRMGGVSKPLMKINGRQAILYSLDLFMASDDVERVVISARREDMHLLREICARENYMKEIIVTEGGSTRQDSVKRAFKAAFEGRKKTKLVAIHDGARPLITAEEFSRVVKSALQYGNAVCAARAKDTFKTTDENCVVNGHVERENLWHIQTPQVFDTDIFHTSLALAEKNGTQATDESGLVSAAGFVVKLVECGHDNIKLTYPEDVFIAEAILLRRKSFAENSPKGENL